MGQEPANGGAQGAIIRVLALYSETALHPGSGSTTGVIDLPVQRERHTHFPIIVPSSVKGSFRELGEVEWGKGDAKVVALFGPETRAEEGLHKGAISFGEAQLVAFPVRSSSQVFVWVTCPLVIDRLRQNLRRAGIPLPELTSSPAEMQLVAPRVQGNTEGLSRQLVLEDLSFSRQEAEDVATLVDKIGSLCLPDSHATMRQKISRHLVVVSNQNYEHLVRTATQVTARIALNDRKTTTGDGGNLWYEETLPRDCLFSVLLRFEKPRTEKDTIKTPEEVRTAFEGLIRNRPYLQVGGNETVGQGWCVLRLVS